MPDGSLLYCQKVALCAIFVRGTISQGRFPATGLQGVKSAGAVSSATPRGLKIDKCLLHVVLRDVCFSNELAICWELRPSLMAFFP